METRGDGAVQHFLLDGDLGDPRGILELRPSSLNLRDGGRSSAILSCEVGLVSPSEPGAHSRLLGRL